MIALVASAVLLAQASSPQTLAGIAVGSPVKDAVAAHRGKSVASKYGPTWTWQAPGLGTVSLTADEDGNAGIVDVTIAAGVSNVSLPGAAAFPIGAGREKYSDVSSFVESDDCAPTANGGVCAAYTLDDGELVLQFGPGGILREALWGDRTMLKTLNVIQAQTAL